MDLGRAAKPAGDLVREQPAPTGEHRAPGGALHEAGQHLVVVERSLLDALAGTYRELERLEQALIGPEPLLASEMAAIKYADLIPAIMRTSVKHGMRLPRDFVLVTKQMLYFDRYAKLLAPTLNVFRDPRIVGALAMDVMAARLQTE